MALPCQPIDPGCELAGEAADRFASGGTMPAQPEQQASGKVRAAALVHDGRSAFGQLLDVATCEPPATGTSSLKSGTTSEDCARSQDSGTGKGDEVQDIRLHDPELAVVGGNGANIVERAARRMETQLDAAIASA